MEFAQRDRAGAAWNALRGVVAEEGSAAQSWPARLLREARPRDLADAIHCLAMLHARHPGLLEGAATRVEDARASDWFARTGAAFAEERVALVRLTAAVGTLPSTPGQSESEAAIAGQRHALDMLAASDRVGCPIGAALSLVLDWPMIRRVMEAAALRTDLVLPPPALPGLTESVAAFAGSFAAPAFERAMLFGAHQTLAQHRALWHLLEARAVARTA